MVHGSTIMAIVEKYLGKGFYDMQVKNGEWVEAEKYISGKYTLTENQKTAAKATDSTKEDPDMLDVIWILNYKTAD